MDHKIKKKVVDQKGELEEAKFKKYEKGCCWTNIGFHMRMKLWDANEEVSTTKLGIPRSHRISFSKKIYSRIGCGKVEGLV